jgi:hypothetical protein
MRIVTRVLTSKCLQDEGERENVSMKRKQSGIKDFRENMTIIQIEFLLVSVSCHLIGMKGSSEDS